MGTRGLGKVRQEALELTASERAELAHDLVVSLDGAADADASEAWGREVLRRLDEIDAGTATLIDREEFSRASASQEPDVEGPHARGRFTLSRRAGGWYDQHCPRLGTDFGAAVDAALDLLEEGIVPLRRYRRALARGVKRLGLSAFRLTSLSLSVPKKCLSLLSHIVPGDPAIGASAAVDQRCAQLAAS